MTSEDTAQPSLAAQALQLAFELERNPTLEMLLKVDDWTHQSDAHMRAFAVIAGIMKDVPAVVSPPAIAPAVIAPAVIAPAIVTPAVLAPAAAAPARVAAAERVPAEPRRFWATWWVGLAAVIAVASVLALTYFYMARPIEYRTFAEARELTLNSGPTAYLFPNTRFKEQRAFRNECSSRLIGGSVSMRVPTAPSQPFCLLSGNTRIEALGTRFNVLYLNGRTSVYLEQGSVRVSLKDQFVVLGPDEFTLASDSGGIEPVSTVHVPGSERPHRVLYKFDNATLPEIADHFNAINSSPRLTVRGTAALRRFDAAFDLADPDALLRILHTDASLNITRENGVVTITAR